MDLNRRCRAQSCPACGLARRLRLAGAAAGATELPALADAVPHSELLEGRGWRYFAAMSGAVWVGLDYGDPGDGHGHPDRLNLVIATP